MNWVILGCAVVIAVGIVTVMRYRAERVEEKRMVKRMRSTQLYGRVCDLLAKHEREYIEQVIIRRDGITLRMFSPAGRSLSYIFEKHGFQPLRDDSVYALALALAVDLRLLGEHDKYRFKQQVRTHSNGAKEPYYTYHVTLNYKDHLTRADLQLEGKRAQGSL